MTNTTVSTLIASFAKANKVSKAKIEALVEEILAITPTKTAKQKVKSTVRADRRANTELQIMSLFETKSEIVVNDLKDLKIKSPHFIINSLVKTGKLKAESTIATGKRGTKSVTYKKVA